MQFLQEYDFLGNIRELRNILWVAAVNAAQGRIAADDIAAALPVPAEGPQPGEPEANQQESWQPSKPLTGRLEARKPWEAEILAEALRQHGGNRRAAAAELGVTERTVYRKLRELGLRGLSFVVLSPLAEVLSELNLSNFLA